MKNLLMIMMLMVSINMLNAQERQRGGFNNSSPEERAKAQVERLEKELKLTKVQKDSIYKISIEQSKAQQGLFQEGQDREQAREKFTALRAKTDEKILAVLDEKQKEKYLELQKQAANRGPGTGRGQQGGGGNRGPQN